MSDKMGEKRAKLVESLFCISSSVDFTFDVQSDGISLDQLPQLFLDEGMFSLVSTMLAHPDKYRMQLGVLLSQVKLDQMPEELKDKLKPHMSGLEYSLETSHGSWYLCGTAEPRLAQAVDEGAVMAIGEEDNPYFLLKFRGKLSALCLQDVTSSEGKVFVRGNWYSPTDSEFRDTLRDEFDRGQGRTSLKKGAWTLMRPIKPHDGKTADELIEEAVQIATGIPDTYPSNDVVVSGVKM